MKWKKRFEWVSLGVLWMILLLLTLPYFDVKLRLYFGYPLVNPFQNEGDFYDPIKGHTGIDIAMPLNTPLAMPVPLRAVDIRVQNEMGNCLYVEDAWGNILVFAHLNAILPEVGTMIKADEVFAHSGNTGTATRGPHLHFEIIAQEAEIGHEIMTRTLGNYSGYNIDPVSYFSLLPNVDAAL
ncbi:M23 family metallopeptidase [Candidatus Peregrinibacteria bacterium]|nr:MAG: M23 family metallopeptidase [Candidatus Peregrinibacteria bacterium]